MTKAHISNGNFIFERLCVTGKCSNSILLIYKISHADYRPLVMG